MTTSQKREIATSATALLFLVIGGTGVMMYFHILDKYTKQMHEILGLAFVVAVVLHVIVHFKSMKNYFTNKVFIGLGFVTLLLALGFILNAPEGKSPKGATFNALFQADTQKSFIIFVEDYDLATIKLEEAGFKIDGLNSINEIAKANKKSPFDVIRVLTN